MDVIVKPDEKNAAEIGQQLLSLADSPNDVQWTSWPTAGFRVPQELAEKLSQLRVSLKLEELADSEPEAATQTPRRRGRPRKQAEPVPGTDDNEKEE